MRPRLLLADEPTAHLDRASARRVTDEIRALAAEASAGVIVVTHDDELAAHADRVLRLDDGTLDA